MGRLYTLFRWEMNDLIKVVLLFFGIMLVGMSMKQELMGVSNSMGFISGTDLQLFEASQARRVSTSIQGMLSLEDVWTLAGFLILLLGALTFRYDRDSGVAKSVYALPYSNDEIFGIKLISLLIYGFLMLLLPFAYVAITTYASIAGYLPEITSRFLSDALLLVAFLVLYLIAAATLVSLASPNAFLAFMAGFAVIYAPKILGNSSMPPALFINALNRCGNTDFNVFKAAYLEWGIVVPIVLFLLSWVLIRRRDVV
ncbi:MAG: type transport system permease protein [Thermococcaceae archaeon]|nr:type transport system permease protein [Thermococcaceae archaeon]MDK2913535.1 type transport system permease protein [Thermococcaceae archaeon]